MHPFSPGTSASRTSTRAACRSSRAPCPSCVRSRALPSERVALDLLVQIGARHIQRPRGFADVPVVLAQLRQQKRSLRHLLELLEGLALEQRADARLIRRATADQAFDVLGS